MASCSGPEYSTTATRSCCQVNTALRIAGVTCVGIVTVELVIVENRVYRGGGGGVNRSSW